MAQIKNIVFDFGGVIVDWNPRYFYRDIFADEAEMEYFLANICSSAWNIEHDRGRTFAEGMRLLQAEHPEYHREIGLYREGWPTMLKGEIPEAVEYLHKLKDRDYRLFGLTNWSAETFDIAYERFDSFKQFEGIVVSGFEKITKPDPRLFGILLDRYGLKTEESLFIDDTAANIDTANALGFKTVHVVSTDQAIRDIEACLS